MKLWEGSVGRHLLDLISVLYVYHLVGIIARLLFVSHSRASSSSCVPMHSPAPNSVRELRESVIPSRPKICMICLRDVDIDSSPVDPSLVSFHTSYHRSCCDERPSFEGLYAKRGASTDNATQNAKRTSGGFAWRNHYSK